MFTKTATVAITGVSKLNSKTAQQLDSFSHRQKEVGKNLIEPELFKAVGGYYDLSDDPLKYLYITARGISVDVPNNNGDAFPKPELWRFTPAKNCFVFQTFIHDPLHLNHVASNPKAARGFILDAHYNCEDPLDEHVELVVAMDTSKDPQLGRKFETGEAKTFSMGCTAEVTQCSICANVARSPSEFCDHIKHYRMQHIGGQQVYEKCYGVDYTELSYVSDPADPKAVTKSTLHAPQAANTLQHSLITKLGLTSGQAKEVVAYFEYNLDKLPDGMVVLGNKLL